MNKGKKAESFIIDYLDSLGKYVYVKRLADTHDANKGRWGDSTQKKVIIPKRPCDAMLIYRGDTYFCEVKSTISQTGLSSNLFSEQKPERIRIVKAGGSYLYLIYSYFKEQWYWIPSEFLNENAKWCELEKFKVDFPKVPL